MGRSDQVGSHKTTVRVSDKRCTVTYHDTDVVTFTEGVIVLQTGGFKTATTKLRMNQASNQYDLGYQVYQVNHEWMVEFGGGVYPFQGDEITLLRREGTVHHREAATT